MHRAHNEGEIAALYSGIQIPGRILSGEIVRDMDAHRELRDLCLGAPANESESTPVTQTIVNGKAAA